MFAHVVTAHDRFNGLHRMELPDPVPGGNEVTIDVAVAGLGLIDALWTTGAMPSLEGFIPGLEVSGTIREVGEGVSGLEPGMPVAAITLAGGGLAEIATAPAFLVSPIPEGLSPELAAVVPVNTVTAHLALTTVARFAAGEAVLVHAGVGGLGSQFAQVARTLGAGRVDAVVGSAAKAEIAREFGYDEVHLRSDLGSIPGETYDVVVDPVGGAASQDAFRVLRGGGRHVRVGNASQAPDVAVSSVAHWLENKSTVGFNVGGWLMMHPADGAASLAWSLNAVAAGDVRVELSQVSALDGLTGLLEDLEQGRTTGKVAVRLR